MLGAEIYLAKVQMEVVEPHMGHMFLVLVASVVSFGITQVVKPFLKGKVGGRGEKGRERERGVVRLIAVLVGGFVGWSLSYEILDMWLGASAGALNVFLVGALKKKALIILGGDKDKDKDKDKETGDRDE